MNPVPIVRGRYRRTGGRKPRHNVRGVERRWRAGRLDGRRRETKQIEAIADEFARDGGGWQCLSSREVALIHVAAFSVWVCQQTAAWALQRAPIIDGNGNLPNVLAKNFIAYANTASRTLSELGLRPQPERLRTPEELGWVERVRPACPPDASGGRQTDAAGPERPRTSTTPNGGDS